MRPYPVLKWSGVCFWIGASFQFGLFSLSDIGPVWGALIQSGITTGGLAAIVMILYLEFTNPRRMRFRSKLHIDALPDLNEFIAKFADRRGWDVAMKERLSAVAEETLLTLPRWTWKSRPWIKKRRKTLSPPASWWLSPPATARWRTWSLSGAETRRTWKTAYASSNNTIPRPRSNRNFHCGCYGLTPRRYSTSSSTISTSSRSRSARPERDRAKPPP